MSDLISNLGIDWKILLAQLVNFAILLFVLKKFAYSPLLSMLNKRRAEIEKSNKRTEEIEEKLKSMEDLKEDVLGQARRQSESIIKKSEESAAKLEEKILSEAREEAKRITESEQKKLSLEREKLVQDVKKEIGQIVSLAIGKSLGDTLDEETQKSLLEKAVSESRSLKLTAES